MNNQEKPLSELIEEMDEAHDDIICSEWINLSRKYWPRISEELRRLRSDLESERLDFAAILRSSDNKLEACKEERDRYKREADLLRAELKEAVAVIIRADVPITRQYLLRKHPEV